jgi:putative tricarboxylic transport membrane protein
VIGNWRCVMAAPGITDAQRSALAGLVDRMVKSPQWKKKLAERGWEDNYLAGSAFQNFLAEEQKRVGEILRSVGLAR